MTGWIGVDLDGTLAHYTGWQGPEHIGAPIPEMLKRVKHWVATGQEVRIFTARVGGFSGPENDRQREIIQRWLEGCGLPKLDVTCSKDYGMRELWDDRAVRVVPNTGKSVEELILTDPDRHLGILQRHRTASGDTLYNPLPLKGA